MKRVHTFAGEIVKLCNFAIVHVYAVKLEVGIVDDDFPSKPSLQGPFEFSFQCGLDEAVDHDKASCLEDPMQWVKMYEYVYTRDFRPNPEVCFGVCFSVWITILYSCGHHMEHHTLKEKVVKPAYLWCSTTESRFVSLRKQILCVQVPKAATH